MRFFHKTNHLKRNIITASLLSIIIIILIIYLLITYKEKSINLITIENDKETLEMDDNNEKKFTDTTDLSTSEFIDMIDYYTNDLLYRNEPYYIIEGWNYSEKYIKSKSDIKLINL